MLAKNYSTNILCHYIVEVSYVYSQIFFEDTICIYSYNKTLLLLGVWALKLHVRIICADFFKIYDSESRG